ncbi:MAG TPA: heme peroxidase family protein, partial [Caldilineaceae bacterium]|nr:heme peroxidase family protein [Caldilineaceae bacterium]
DITNQQLDAAVDLRTDITGDTFAPEAPDKVRSGLKNRLDPFLDLDSVYADGPDGDDSFPDEDKLFDTGKLNFRLGTNATGNSILGEIPDPELDEVQGQPQRDIPRKNKLAVIGDTRNDENTIVSQLHTAFLKFHNAVVAQLGKSTKLSGPALFQEAQQLVRWHYQWLTVNDWLRTITLDGVVDDVLLGGQKFYDPPADAIFMPLEFSVAAFRFGHTMVRAEYDFNRNFTFNGGLVGQATFDFLFAFTGNGGFFGEATLPFNWIAEWERFFGRNPLDDDFNAVVNRFTRKIDTKLAFPLSTMANEQANAVMQHLARRNLRRGFLFSIPTGQSIAKEMKVAVLSERELKKNASAGVVEALERENNLLLNHTPLWFYVLKEAEVRANGNTLGEVGSRIVAETIIGLLRKDPDSYLNHNWDPSKSPLRVGAQQKPIVRIIDMLRFARVAPAESAAA